MRIMISTTAAFLAVVLAAGVTVAQAKKAEKPEPAAKEPAAAPEETPAEEELVAPMVRHEDRLDECQDGQDNDGDSYVDCDDQDCEIYAICVKPPEEEPVDEGPVEPVEPAEPVWIPESGLDCRDGKDNNGDELIDCHEVSCQRYRYCRQIMYETPEPPNKAPGFLISFGGGIALPNFRKPTAEAPSARYGEDLPFDPDIGLIVNLKLGYLPLKWLGFGINLNGMFTVATNEYDGYEDKDDTDEYKYNGSMGGGHVGGFVRFQWPVKRFVPFLDIAAGYSIARYQWDVYDPGNSWDDISTWGSDDDEDDYNPIDGPHDEHRFTTRHFTFALEPGFDVFVVKRVFAVGAHAWLPVVASNDSSTDNVGVMLHLTVTPMWREPKRLKAEYDVAALR